MSGPAIRKAEEAMISPWRASAWRAGAVTLGPSLLLDALVGASLLAVGAGRLRRRRPSRLVRLAAMAPAVYLLAVRPWLLRWGATAEEARAPLPGDDLVPEPAVQSTRAITIDAPVEAVWPWLVQMGQGRGGFYSDDWLENLAGCDLRSADGIVPEYQALAAGDFIRAMPEPAMPGAGWEVAAIEPNRALVLKGWGAFVLRPLDRDRTRLIARSRGGGTPRWRVALANALTWEIPHFVMERKMLLGIKARAERSSQSRR